jgi:hypothetical protein
VKKILKVEREKWVNISFHLPEATKRRIPEVRKAAEKQNLDFNAMCDEAINELFDLIVKPSGKSTGFTTNGALTSDAS